MQASIVKRTLSCRKYFCGASLCRYLALVAVGPYMAYNTKSKSITDRNCMYAQRCQPMLLVGSSGCYICKEQDLIAVCPCVLIVNLIHIIYIAAITWTAMFICHYSFLSPTGGSHHQFLHHPIHIQDCYITPASH